LKPCNRTLLDPIKQVRAYNKSMFLSLSRGIEQMNYTQTLIDEYKRALKIKNDSALAENLKMTRATISRWRNGNGHPEPAIAWQIAEAIGRNPAEVLVCIEAERATSLVNAQAWGRVRNMYIMSSIAAHMRRKLLLQKRA